MIDSAGDILDCLKRAFRKAGLPFASTDRKAVIGPPLKEMIRFVMPDIREEQEELVAGYFRSFYDASEYGRTRLLNGVRRTLEALSRSSYKLFVLTNKRMLPTKRMLKLLKVDAFFSGIFTPDMHAGIHLSKTEALGELLRRLRLKTADTLLVGDACGDIIAAKDHRIRSVAVLNGYGEKASLLAAKPSYAVKEMRGLRKLIRKIDKGG
ncbi:MAG: HAD family hydrolase [Elusimicrobia bacterium]|nr:HAD family hydrolase [Elusimicrobiota bacterium]